MSSDEPPNVPAAGLAAELAELRLRNEALENSLRDLQTASTRRMMDAELKTEALRKGIVDLDGLKLISADEVSVDEAGAVHGAQAAIARLKRDKPWLFGGATSSSMASVPAAAPARTRMATEMTLDEWRQARAELLRRR